MTYEIKYYEQTRGDGTVYYFAKVIFTERVKIFGLFWWKKKETLYAGRFGVTEIDFYEKEYMGKFENLEYLKQKTEEAAKYRVAQKQKDKVVSCKQIG